MKDMDGIVRVACRDTGKTRELSERYGAATAMFECEGAEEKTDC